MEIRKNKTKTDMEAVSNQVLDTCSEPDCGMSIMVDKDLKDMGRKARCSACLMRHKITK